MHSFFYLRKRGPQMVPQRVSDSNVTFQVDSEREASGAAGQLPGEPPPPPGAARRVWGSVSGETGFCGAFAVLRGRREYFRLT